MGYYLKAEKQKEELRDQIKRWTWRGRPTRKVRKLQSLERKIEILGLQAKIAMEGLNILYCP
jgi:hypothetical protein